MAFGMRFGDEATADDCGVICFHEVYKQSFSKRK